MEGKGPRFERETVITFNETESSASVWTASETSIGGSRTLATSRHEDNERSAVFEIPKSVVRDTESRESSEN